MSNPYYYIGVNPTCDLIILNPENKILLIKRNANAPACPDQWALPGGFIDTTAKKGEVWIQNLETPKQAALRELKEETNLTLPDNIIILPIGVYEGNNRDPRDNPISWSKSHAFFAAIDAKTYLEQKGTIEPLSDAAQTKWFSFDEVHQIKDQIAFDHIKIIEDAKLLYIPSLKKYKTI